MAFAYGVWYSFPVFFVAILKEFGWSRAGTSGALSLFVFTHGLLGALVGELVERLGPRRVVTGGTLILALGLGASSRITTQDQLYIFFGLITSLGVTLIGWVATSTAVRRWFPDRVGTALGFSSAGMGAGILIFAPLSQYLIDRVGWRFTYLILALLVVGILTPAVWVFLRSPSRPRSRESTGVSPRALVVNRQWAQTSWTLRKAMGTRQFWLLTLAFSLGVFTSQGVHLHQVAFLVDHGFGASFAAGVLGLLGAVSIGGRILWGVLSERIGRELTHSLAYATIIVAVLCLLAAGHFESAGFAISYGVLFGLGYAIVAPITPAISSDLFQGPTFGRIFGALTISHGLGSAAGAWVGGYLHDVLGSYTVGFIAVMVTGALSTVMVWIAAPRKIRCVPGRIPKKTTALDSLFVYGTLMKGFPLHSHLQEGTGSRYLGQGEIAAKLIDLGEYPGALPGSGTETVCGEVYELLDPDLLDHLDFVEDSPPHGRIFLRSRVRVKCSDRGEVEAWSYFYEGSLTGSTPISSGDYRQFKRAVCSPRDR